MIDDEKFFAWLDGELDGGEADDVAAMVAADPALARRAEAHRVLGSRLRGAFDPLMTAAVPDRIGAAPADFAAAREARRPPRALPQWAAIAATLVVGVTIGSFAGRGSDAPFGVEGGQLVAAAALDQALDTQLASAGQPGEGPRIGLTYRAADGSICRTFSGSGGSGLACKDGADWQVRGLFGGGEASGADYRMAAGEDPRLAALVADTIAGEPYDAAQEQAAKTKGWR